MIPKLKFRIVPSIIVGLFITCGLAVLFQRYEIFPSMQLLKIFIYLSPLAILFSIVFYLFIPIPSLGVKLEQDIINFIISLLVSLLLTFDSDFSIRYLFKLFVVVIMFFIMGSTILFLTKNEKVNLIRYLYLFVSFLIGMSGVSIFLFMSFFTRIYADDFCFTNYVNNNGLINTIIWWYRTWSGRVFSDLFMFGFSSTRIMPFIEIVILIATTFLIIWKISQTKDKNRFYWAISTGLFLPTIVFSTIPDLYKSLYWITNTELIFPVLLVIIIFIGFLSNGYVRGFKSIPLSSIIIFTLALSIASGHEIMLPALYLIITVFLLNIVLKKPINKQMLIIFISAVVGAVIGSLILILAPGNYARMEYQGYPPAPDLMVAIRISLDYFLDFIFKGLKHWGWALWFAALVSGLFLSSVIKRSWKVFIQILGVTIVSSWGTFLISSFAMSDTLPTRTQIIPMVFLVYGLFCTGLTMPKLKENKNLTILAVASTLIVAVASIGTMKKNIKLIAPIVGFAREWDIRDQLLRNSDIEPYSIIVPWESHEAKVECMEEYYSR